MTRECNTTANTCGYHYAHCTFKVHMYVYTPTQWTHSEVSAIACLRCSLSSIRHRDHITLTPGRNALQRCPVNGPASQLLPPSVFVGRDEQTVDQSSHLSLPAPRRGTRSLNFPFVIRFGRSQLAEQLIQTGLRVLRHHQTGLKDPYMYIHPYSITHCTSMYIHVYT